VGRGSGHCTRLLLPGDSFHGARAEEVQAVPTPARCCRQTCETSCKLTWWGGIRQGTYAVLGHWLGKVDEALDSVLLRMADGSVCRVANADPEVLIPVEDEVRRHVGRIRRKNPKCGASRSVGRDT